MNLLGGWVFIGACSSESEGLQQPVKLGQTDDIGCRRAERHRRANGRIKHPGGDDNRYAWFTFDHNDVSSRPSFRVKLPNLAAVKRVPAVMDLDVAADMGRMTPQSPWADAIICSRDRIPAESGPPRSTAWCRQRSSTVSIRKPICGIFWPRSQRAIRSTGSTSYCPGVWSRRPPPHHHSRPIPRT
jgi:hypothetical protein